MSPSIFYGSLNTQISAIAVMFPPGMSWTTERPVWLQNMSLRAHVCVIFGMN